MTAGALATALLVLSAVALPARSEAAATPRPVLWLVKSQDLAALEQQAGTDGVSLPAFTWIGCGGLSDVYPCVPGQAPIFTDYWQLRSWAEAGWHGTAVFDIEPWIYTPLAQRQDPDKFICLAAELQQTDPHLHVIITPFKRPPATEMIAEDVEAARCGAYAVDVQSQFANGSPQQFGWFIRKAVRAIRSVNSKILVMAGLATNQPNVMTPANLEADYYEALAAGVGGFWLNANDWGGNACTMADGGPSCPEIGLQFLEDIGLITTGGSSSTNGAPGNASGGSASSSPGNASGSSGNATGGSPPAGSPQAPNPSGDFVQQALDDPFAAIAEALAVIAATGPGQDGSAAVELILGELHPA